MCGPKKTLRKEKEKKVSLRLRLFRYPARLSHLGFIGKNKTQPHPKRAAWEDLLVSICKVTVQCNYGFLSLIKAAVSDRSHSFLLLFLLFFFTHRICNGLYLFQLICLHLNFKRLFQERGAGTSYHVLGFLRNLLLFYDHTEVSNATTIPAPLQNWSFTSKQKLKSWTKSNRGDTGFNQISHANVTMADLCFVFFVWESISACNT